MGRAERCENTAWTCICGEDFTRQYGELICLQLGFSGLYRYSTGPAQCTSRSFTNINCPADATSFQQCNGSVTTSSCIQVRIECNSKFIHNHKLICICIALYFSSATSQWNTTTTRQLSSPFSRWVF